MYTEYPLLSYLFATSTSLSTIAGEWYLADQTFSPGINSSATQFSGKKTG